jgi:hypothetical protein
MLKFYGCLKNNLWYITDKMPEKESYIVIHAKTRHDAECQLFEMVVEHNPRIYL